MTTWGGRRRQSAWLKLEKRICAQEEEKEKTKTTGRLSTFVQKIGRTEARKIRAVQKGRLLTCRRVRKRCDDLFVAKRRRASSISLGRGAQSGGGIDETVATKKKKTTNLLFTPSAHKGIRQGEDATD